ncbi:transmembrane protein 69-like [Boleophthalmus pectinirostris]|uniref:transmembrane protein 69-like n=1 Tax=Boleophthalmus pectinirostris TaxID=150288 RepID=UPI000A1C2860|nr:transmembrane protein 69-like [Boleophthalmus pectinirostris]XP_020795158.1 transmembrane protein 69-like [Boleophthalmus pectinirostris]XP_020795159.1 transmembrane protein 69-like [Boleophthalmus pectinirostris]XP_055007781.1 transmembrane protein 69-like [Boleophthalmus pectinirostris]XP_055007782.1 transmembrane protein 69-like [Boleophthalmus pectinirostris]
MLKFASRGITTKVTVWRYLQKQTFRSHKLSTNSHVFFHLPSSPHRWNPKSSFLSTRPITWRFSCLCHERATGENPQEHEKNSFSLKALFQSPKPALYLGFSGLIPFMSAPVLMVATSTFYPEVAYAQMVYGASIVSFLGGARWGFALPEGSPAQPDWKNLGNSVVPSLLAWMALLCRDNIAEGALVVIMGLGLSLHYDLTLLPEYPAWFKALRTILTLVATFSLVATLALKNIYSEKVKQ